jgi:hypothetical protein
MKTEGCGRWNPECSVAFVAYGTLHEQTKLVFHHSVQPLAYPRRSRCAIIFPNSSRPKVALDLAFPPADGAVRNCLTHVLDVNGVTKRYLMFFAFLFKAIWNELKRNKTTRRSIHTTYI